MSLQGNPFAHRLAQCRVTQWPETHEIQQRHMRAQLAKASQARDFPSVGALLQARTDSLTESERKKLEYAPEKCCSGATGRKSHAL